MCLERSSPCSPSESWCTLLSDLGLFRKHQLMVIGAGKIHWIYPSSPLTVTAIMTEAFTIELLLLDWADRCWGLGPGSHIGQVWGSSQSSLVQSLRSTVAWIKFACEELGDLQRTWKPRVPIPRMNIRPGWVWWPSCKSRSQRKASLAVPSILSRSGLDLKILIQWVRWKRYWGWFLMSIKSPHA